MNVARGQIVMKRKKTGRWCSAFCSWELPEKLRQKHKAGRPSCASKMSFPPPECGVHTRVRVMSWFYTRQSSIEFRNMSPEPLNPRLKPEEVSGNVGKRSTTNVARSEAKLCLNFENHSPEAVSKQLVHCLN